MLKYEIKKDKLLYLLIQGQDLFIKSGKKSVRDPFDALKKAEALGSAYLVEGHDECRKAIGHRSVLLGDPSSWR